VVMYELLTGELPGPARTLRSIGGLGKLALWPAEL
jgi:hypothetical protein